VPRAMCQGGGGGHNRRRCRQSLVSGHMRGGCLAGAAAAERCWVEGWRSIRLWPNRGNRELQVGGACDHWQTAHRVFAAWQAVTVITAQWGVDRSKTCCEVEGGGGVSVEGEGFDDDGNAVEETAQSRATRLLPPIAALYLLQV
jgi:hypothetical protein